MSTTTTVYRVETRYGFGPYAGNYEFLTKTQLGLRNRICDVHEGSDDHPGIRNDPGLPNEDYYCGFAELEDAAAWFDGFGKALRRASFHISIYEIDPRHVRQGRTQLCFRLAEATFVRRIPTTEVIA
ncbi:hypothetical protein ACIA8K_12775 [Catenuloplanes sp. NPDC051500]|uniref:hypothetical protein n=1 Tax=Catenuloplanes sp. NPDC051500 TaxID=3363959 RepID=UPI0037995478